MLEPFERGPVHGGREMMPSHRRSFDPDPCSLREREAGGVRATEAIGVGTGEVPTDLLGLDRGYSFTATRCSSVSKGILRVTARSLVPLMDVSDRANRL